MTIARDLVDIDAVCGHVLSGATSQSSSLLDFVPRSSPRYSRPNHLARVAELFERAKSEPVRAVISLPPRHGKTELVKHYVAWRLLAEAHLRFIYASYAQRFAEKRTREMRALYRRVGGRLDPTAKSRSDWRTLSEPGGVWATSVGGSVTGEGGDVIIVDDPHKGRAESESAIEREKVRDWFKDDLSTRAEPGASVFVIQTRWHPEDLAGTLIGEGWEHVSIPAISEEGEALWPERFPADRLQEIRESIGEYSWSSLYMQAPIRRGGQLFQDCYFYDELPKQFRIGKGIDLAYTAKTRADKSASVVLLAHAGEFYVVDVRTAQTQVPDFLRVLATVDMTYPGPWHWYVSTTETGVAQLSTAVAGVRVIAERAKEDKFMRAQAVAACWNMGKVHVPRRAPWLDRFVAVVCGFVGVGDKEDDEVDALASAFRRLGGISATKPGHEASLPQAINGPFQQW